ncbi:MAG: amidophosphoribosyltransferase [Bacteroidota bacterium]
MSDKILHECGVAVIRLLKPLEYYLEKYKTPFYATNKLALLLEKQHNRGQDGAGAACIKFDVPPGNPYINRCRSNEARSLDDVVQKINSRFNEVAKNFPEKLNDVEWLKTHVPFIGELFLGHLRYGTYGLNGIDSCHPFLRQNNWMTRNLVLAGNFNLTNVDEMFDVLVDLGQHPKEKADTVTVLEKIGHFLDEENEILFRKFKDDGYTNKEISHKIGEHLDIQKILTRSSRDWDGGYVITGLIGHGDAFVLRDPAGIRPVFYYHDDEIVVVTSERPAIQTAFNVAVEDIKEIQPGSALVIKKNGAVNEYECKKPVERKSCSFERIYFSRGSDVDIYKERIKLGHSLVPAVLKSVDNDCKNTVFSFIPNTAEVAFYGMMKGVEDYLNEVKRNKILKLGTELNNEKLTEILSIRPRAEKIAIKDAKLRTFITNDTQRDELVGHVYDITYGTIVKGVDNLVVIDDSIVRGTTLKQSILRMLDRLGPKKIVIVSSAPQIRYPDCYGIDMAKLGDFAAFSAAIELLHESNQEELIEEVYFKSVEQLYLPSDKVVNHVKNIYNPFTPEQISAKMAQMLKPKGINAEVEIIFQTIEDLHVAIPQHTGDWYFTGNYPTPGGNKVVNKAFINYYEGKNERAY